MLHEQLIFLIGAPRSGSTLLQRMLGSHSAIYTHPEPHLLTPLYYSGYYATVDRAPYDHVNAAQALRELCEELPGGEADYLTALRAYPSTLYAKLLAPSGKTHFLDKTPAYALILPFIAKLYPRAKYVVLTRHPLAIMHSVAHSFFGGDYAHAERVNPIVSRYVPAIADFLAHPSVQLTRVRYEDLVQEPEREMRRVLGFLDLPYEARVVTYGEQSHVSKSFGDPVAVSKHDRPVTDSLATFAQDLRAKPAALALAQDVIGRLDPAALSAWGYDKGALFAPVGDAAPKPTARPRLNSYALKRRALLQLRRNVHGGRLGGAVKKLRYACDVLLRDT